MQELLGRLSALDPAASQSLRVIACFDELIAGDVGVRGLLSAAAALSGRTVGLVRGDTMTRVDHRGEVLPSTTPPATAHCVLPDTLVWIETSTPDTESLDVLIVERLSLALLIRLDSRRITPPPRALTVITDRGTAAAERRAAALRLGLHAGEAYRVIVAPLFASWRSHPRGPEDVVATACGPVHTSIVTADASAEGTPSGLGSATAIDELDHSFRTAMIALRLHDGGDRGTRADDFGGLADVLADLPEDRHSGDDLTNIESAMRHPWGARTIEALIGASSVREAARAANIHHSTMADRLTIITTTLKFNPVTGIGRTRLGLAYLQWRLQTSRVFEFIPQPFPR